ncbi:WxL domain-containing protein [Spirillospora sp. NPDC048819]|uniref:WxL domain-containing protein n=1 Tax=Spirillospora sp. NPDC048819 TaxID=3155268 RepID=UPI00340483D2
MAAPPRLRALAVAVAVAGASLVPAMAGQAAFAGTAQVGYDCTVLGNAFSYPATVTVTAPATATTGDDVTVEVDLSDMPSKSPLPVLSWTTSGTMALSGAVTGEFAFSTPTQTGNVPANVPIPINKLTGKFNASAAGDIAIVPKTVTMDIDASGVAATIACQVSAGAPALATVKVGNAGPSLTIEPATVHQGGSITVGGARWESGPVELALCDENGAACAAGGLTGVSASADASGKLTGTAKVAEDAAPGTRTIVARQGSVEKSVGLTVTEKVPPPTGACADKPVGQCGEQRLNLSVAAGKLTMSQQPGEVDLGAVTLDGTAKTATGDIKRVEVIDARGGATGWSLTATMTDFASAGGPKIPAGNLSWTPGCTSGPGATPVTAGSPGPLSSTTAATLCSGPNGEGGAVVGGTYTADAGLELDVPAVTGAGQYQAVLTIVLS